MAWCRIDYKPLFKPMMTHFSIRKSSALDVLDCILLHCLRKLQSYKRLQDNPCKLASVTAMYLCKDYIPRLVEDRPNILVNAILHICLQAREQPWVVSMKVYMNTGKQGHEYRWYTYYFAIHYMESTSFLLSSRSKYTYNLYQRFRISCAL